MRARVLITLSLAAAVVAVVVVAAVTNGSRHGAGRSTVSIAVGGGISLQAQVATPSGAGPFPLVVMPASWGSRADEYAKVAARLARSGYLVVSYAQRGFGGSGGEVDFAGVPTQRDVSTVITWALSHTPADARRIGAVGVSYGAGVSLLAAARDPRIHAVVALSGWADFAASLAPGGVVNVQALSALLHATGVAKHANADVRAIGAALLAGNTAAATQVVTSMSAVRSAVTNVGALNRNHTAVMLANAYQDSVVSSASVIPFFVRLTGPKRLQLESGDHGGPERSGLNGADSTVWQDATAWLDHFVKGTRNAIAGQPAVQLRDVRTGQWHGYSDWAAAGRATTLALGNPATGAVTASRRAPWAARITGGVDTSADAGAAQYFSARAYTPPSAAVGAISPAVALRWNTPAVRQSTAVSGMASLHLTVSSTAARAALFTYLYDVDASGTGSLMTSQPYLLAAVAGRASAITVHMPPIAWTIAAGHHLSVIVDTVDPRYAEATKRSTALTFTSSAVDPAALSLPLS